MTHSSFVTHNSGSKTPQDIRCLSIWAATWSSGAWRLRLHISSSVHCCRRLYTTDASRSLPNTSRKPDRITSSEILEQCERLPLPVVSPFKPQSCNQTVKTKTLVLKCWLLFLFFLLHVRSILPLKTFLLQLTRPKRLLSIIVECDDERDKLDWHIKKFCLNLRLISSYM